MENLNNPNGTQVIAEDTQRVQTPQTPAPEVVDVNQYRHLEADYTRSRQEAIELAVTLAETAPEKLSTIRDERILNAVVKRVYGFDTYAQMTAVLGENFHQTTEEKNLDKTEQLEREVKLLKYRSESEAFDNAVNAYISQNKELFTNPESVETLKSEMKYFPSDMPLAERIKRASIVTFGKLPTEQNPYKQVAVTPSGGNNTMGDMSQNDAEIQKHIDAGLAFLGLNKKS